MARATGRSLDAVLAMPVREFRLWLPEIERLRNVEFSALVQRFNSLIK